MPRGRPPAPEPDAATLRRLRHLYEARQRAEVDQIVAAEALARAAAEADEEGVTRRQVADALGVGPSTVQGWVNHGRRLLQSPE